MHGMEWGEVVRGMREASIFRIKVSFMKLERPEREERNFKLYTHPDSRNSGAFLLAGWEGRFGRKTNTVGWLNSNRERSKQREASAGLRVGD